MPYFTKKGTGKDKGKTCVYKKEDKTKVGCTDGPVEKYLAALHMNESDDMDWIRDVGFEFNATMLRYGQKFQDNLGKHTRIIMFTEQDDPKLSYEKPMTLLTFKIIYDPSGYIPYPARPKDDPLNSELTMNPIDFDNGLKSGKYTPILDDDFKLKESVGDDFDWIRDVETTKQIEPNTLYYFEPNLSLDEIEVEHLLKVVDYDSECDGWGEEFDKIDKVRFF